MFRAAALTLVLGWLGACGKVDGDDDTSAQGGRANGGFTSSSGGAGNAGGAGSPAADGGAVALGGFAGTSSASGGARSSCAFGPPRREPWCDGATHLRVQQGSASCRFTIEDAPADALTARTWANELIVAFTLNSGEGQEAVPFLSDSEASCSERLGNKSPAWYIDFDANPAEIGLCSCSCERLESVGTLDVIFGCGGGPLYTG